MKLIYLCVALLLVISSDVQAQMWQETVHRASGISVEREYVIDVEDAKYYSLDAQMLQAKLRKAHVEGTKSYAASKAIIELPSSEGILNKFYMVEAPVMEAGLQEKYPYIRTYKGYAIDNSGTNVRISLHHNRMYAAIHKNGKIDYIDYQGPELYVVYDVNKAEYGIDPNIPFCGVDHGDGHEYSEKSIAQLRNKTSETVPIHQYRLAISCTGEYGKWKGTAEKALADIVIGVNRMNQIFENELSMRLILVDNNDKLFFFDPETDPYTNTSSGSAMLGINTAVINSKIGGDAYDIGHVYSRRCDVGGVASLGSMCTVVKGNACTCHYRNDIDYMASRVTSHEIGHQMSALHTFNNCNGNESLGNGFEPGSGSTIMSYGGLCGPQNVVGLADDYYHGASLEQIYSHLRNSGTADACAVKIPTENYAPVISLDYKNGFSIPTETYFYLDGQATDANNDKLTYTWEQRNAGSQSQLGMPMGGAPNFRCYPPSDKSYRFFQRPKNILSGTGIATEVLPKERKEMKFKLVVRDNHPSGGYSDWEEVRFWVIPSDDGEKFRLTNFDKTASLTPGQDTTITWNVAHTAESEINCKHVDLYAFSGGANDFSFDNFFLVKKGIPNTGEASFKVPNFIAKNVRFILKASNSIFFTISRGSVDIEAPESPTFHVDYNNGLITKCLPEKVNIELKTYGYGGIEGEAKIEVVNDLPEGVNYSIANPSVKIGESFAIEVDGSNVESQRFDLDVAIISGTDTVYTSYPIRLINSDYSDISFVSPPLNKVGVGVSTAYEWTPSVNAQSYNLTVATSPSFDANTVVLEEKGLTKTMYESTLVLAKNTAYYWKVEGQNECGTDAHPQVGAFSTEVLSCRKILAEDLPVPISASGRPTVVVPITVRDEGIISDISVRKLVIEHGNNKDLIISLQNPAGNSVTLVRNKCSQRNINCAFDDSSTVPVKCPLNSQRTYKPQEPLSLFDGTEGKGTWTLKVEDTKSGNGGRVNEIELELCTNASLSPPKLVLNNGMNIAPSAQQTIQNWHLRAEDADNTDTEIIYTLVEIPTLGKLSYYTSPLKVGDIFTQQDLYNLYINYTAGEEAGKDRFTFTIHDGEGGFVGISSFDIDINQDYPTSTKDSDLSKIKVYPNPTSSTLTIELGGNSNIESIKLYDVLGNLVRNIDPLTRSLIVDKISTGIYYMIFQNGTEQVSKKIIKL